MAGNRLKQRRTGIRNSGSPLEVFKTVRYGPAAKWALAVAGRAVSLGHGSRKGRIRIILTSDRQIRRLNARFLKRNRPTDVLAFPLRDGVDDVFGEVYVSIDRAREQASLYRVDLKEELARLVIHGMLHLFGYSDRNKAGKLDMRKVEEAFLAECRDAGLLG